MIEKGSKVVIEFSNGKQIRGTVDNKQYYEGLGYSLEISRENSNGGSWGSCRWRQWEHGGIVREC
jgi:hypothetical protein